MAMTDPIADMLTRIRNAVMVKHEKVDIPASGIKNELASLMKEEGFIRNFKIIKDRKQDTLRVYLKYETEDAISSIRGLERVSKPGRRVYVGKKDVPRVLKGLGVSVLSTNKGIISDRSAREIGVGGELICKIW
ncbi:MAG: 30S ribosomal protein S8 [Nitrospinae bacterium]|nr:30S ribosomal protein S8 [Nitrospinota bacterium]